ncbi:unnamed protein product [Ectocarpus sp. CCAP 1310/34]|nr:unnamed protein product [Ectocarpus sp. CCAP 1310/34]
MSSTRSKRRPAPSAKALDLARDEVTRREVARAAGRVGFAALGQQHARDLEAGGGEEQAAGRGDDDVQVVAAPAAKQARVRKSTKWPPTYDLALARAGIVGSLMYIAQVLRYDIMYATGQLARPMAKPSKVHMVAAKHTLRYLAGTIDFSITYKKGGFKLATFSDSNWANNPDNGKSTSSYLTMLANAPMSFRSGLQGLTAMSTMEAELVASALAMKEAVFCSNMMTELGFGKEFAQLPVYCDNTATLHALGNRSFSSRTKHIALRTGDGGEDLHSLRPDGGQPRRHR